MNGLCLLLPLLLAGQAGTKPDLRCGSYCLYVSLKALDLPVGSYEELEEKLGEPSLAGHNLGQLAEAAENYGGHTLGVKTSFANLRRRPGRFACIAHLNGNHFVNIARVTENEAYIVDPPRDYWAPLDTLHTQWDGTALLLSAEPLLAEEDLPADFPWWMVWVSLSACAAMAGCWLVVRKMRTGAGV